MYGEDADYGWRLNRAGFKVVFVPDASVAHMGSYSGNKRWGAIAMVRRQLALHELLRKWYSPYHAWAYRLGITLVLGSRLVWVGIRRVLWRATRGESDFPVTLLLLRCNLGLLVDEEI
jgi:GT2 family glycosyltransferase